MKVAFCTLGCKVNQYDTQTMLELFTAQGYEIVPFEEYADVYIINTCTVTGTGDTKSRQMAGRARRANPKAVIGLVGCYPQRSPEEALGIGSVDFIAGTAQRARIVDMVKSHIEGRGRRDLVSAFASGGYEELGALAHEGRTRAYIKIQDGCENFCTYCAIPYARGPVRSRSLRAIEEEALKLAQAGFQEIVITGVHIASFGKDTGDRPIDAIRAVADCGVARVRLGSVDPLLLDEAFCAAVSKIDNLCPHFHVSLQSGSDAVLKRMGRGYDTALYEENIRRLRRHYAVAGITTDVMVGFPGESEQEFSESYSFVEHMAFSRIHVFSYSKRSGTPAASYGNQLEKSVKDVRNAQMTALGKRLKERYEAAKTGQKEWVLFETEKDGRSQGYTGDYVKVCCPGAHENELRYVELLKYDGERQTGRLIV
ncbi:MAG: tRNA (N(6)-L-threonylcarbamoyladenosine(37)-C(2))-methylthiotransferase MtaB [Christensenellales bacterium]|jgi:threonylcarbamoyladenosine tRNA methylthiotransferase MtaB